MQPRKERAPYQRLGDEDPNDYVDQAMGQSHRNFLAYEGNVCYWSRADGFVTKRG